MSIEKNQNDLLDRFGKYFPSIPSDIVANWLNNKYLDDSRSFEEIEKEIIDFANKINDASMLIDKHIDQEILDKTIILIGPIGSGKSTLSSALCKKCDLPSISLDDKKQLWSLYEQYNNFGHFKDFEFWLTANVLTNLNVPAVIDFGGGHSIYENPLSFYLMKKLVTRFKNVELLMPSEDKDESFEILRQRLEDNKYDMSDWLLSTNRHFIDSPCNYELASNTVYTKGLSIEEISNVIMDNVLNNSMPNKM